MAAVVKIIINHLKRNDMSNYQIPMKGEEITSRLQSIGTKSDTAAEDTAFGRIAKNTEAIEALARRQYDYLKINGLTTNSTSEQVKAALTPIGGTEVVFPTNGDTITNGTSISIEVLNASSNTFSYIYNNQLVSFGISLAEGREAVTSKAQTSLLKQMYDFAKINALTDDSDNDDIEAAIRQLQTSTVSAPSAGALLVDASTLAPLAVVTDSSSDASAHIETFSYTHGGVKYTVTISGEQGALTAKVSTQAVTQRRYPAGLFTELTKDSTSEQVKAAITPIGETEPVFPTLNDVLVPDSYFDANMCFLNVSKLSTDTYIYTYCFWYIATAIISIQISKQADGTWAVYQFDTIDSQTLKELKTTVTEQGTEIENNTNNINGLHKMDVISDSVQVVFKQYMSRETGKEEKEFMIQAPKGMLSGDEKVKLYRKLSTRYRISENPPYQHRVKSGWIRYFDYKSGIESEDLYSLEAVPFESSNSSYEYDYFRIAWINGNYKERFDEMLRNKCSLMMNEDTKVWKYVRIKNGRKAKKLLNYSDSNGFVIPVAFVTWGVQIVNPKGESYTPIIPFKVRYQMGNPAHQGKIPKDEADLYTLDNLYISMSK